MVGFLGVGVARGGIFVVVGTVSGPMAWFAALVAVTFGSLGVGLVLEHEVHHLSTSDGQVVGTGC